MQKVDSMSNLTVIIPTADRERFLKRAVESVLSQSVTPDKIIVVDNGNTPVKSTFTEDLVEVVRTNPRIGCGKPRNIGAQRAETKLVAFLDDDDYWDSDYIKNSLKRFTDDIDVVVGQLKRQQEDGSLVSYKSFPDADAPELQRKIFFSNPGFGGQNVTIRKNTLAEIGWFDEQMVASVDRDLAAKLLLKGKHIAFEPNAIAILVNHSEKRIRRRQVKGNWQFIKKYWKFMYYRERFKVSRVFIKRLVKSKLVHL